MEEEQNAVPLVIHLHDEVQLLDWGETRASGPYIKLRLKDSADLEPFRGMDTATAKRTGHVLHCTIASGDIAAMAQEQEEQQRKAAKGEHGQWWRGLFAFGTFQAPEVLRALGDDSQFLNYLRALSCKNCGTAPHWENERWIESIPAHFESVARGHGKAIKAEYSALPLCDACHKRQHQHGWSALQCGDREQAQKWAATQRTNWAKHMLAHQFAVESLSDIDPADAITCFFQPHDLMRFLPEGYRHATSTPF